MSKDDPYFMQEQAEARDNAATSARLERETEESDVKWLMSSKRGRRIIWRLLDQTGVFRSSFNTTAMQMAFNEGFRNFGNRMLALVHQHCPELYPQMMKENTHGTNPNGSSRNDQ